MMELYSESKQNMHSLNISRELEQAWQVEIMGEGVVAPAVHLNNVELLASDK